MSQFRLHKAYSRSPISNMLRLDRDYIPVSTRVKLPKKVVIQPESEVIISGYAEGVKDKST